MPFSLGGERRANRVVKHCDAPPNVPLVKASHTATPNISWGGVSTQEVGYKKTSLSGSHCCSRLLLGHHIHQSAEAYCKFWNTKWVIVINPWGQNKCCYSGCIYNCKVLGEKSALWTLNKVHQYIDFFCCCYFKNALPRWRSCDPSSWEVLCSLTLHFFSLHPESIAFIHSTQFVNFNYTHICVLSFSPRTVCRKLHDDRTDVCFTPQLIPSLQHGSWHMIRA